jgi:hypothetical protein
MNIGSVIETYDNLIKQLGEAFYAVVASEVVGENWRDASLDVRYVSDGSSWHKKGTVTTAAGRSVRVGIPHDIELILLHLNEVRQAWPQGPSYGLVLRVSESLEAEVKLNYDASCADDPSFFVS